MRFDVSSIANDLRKANTRRTVSDLLADAKRRLVKWVGYAPKGRPLTLFLSYSDMRRSATVVNASASNLDQAWLAVVKKLQRELRAGAKIRAVRFDLVTAIYPSNRQRLEGALGVTKRNYFRYGVAFDKQFHVALLEQEANANAVFYGGPKQENAVWNAKNLRHCLTRKYGPRGTAAIKDAEQGGDLYLFSTHAVFGSLDEGCFELEPHGLEAGRRKLNANDVKLLDNVISGASDYLARQVDKDGQFCYGRHPCFDRRVGGYNTLRHASTTFAMLDAYTVTGDAALRAAVERSLRCLQERYIRFVEPDRLPYDTGDWPSQEKFAFLLDTGDEIKLGGVAVCLLAFVRHAEVTGAHHFDEVMRALANGIMAMERQRNGQMTHVLEYPAMREKEAFRIIYYEGEAAFALSRYFLHSRDARVMPFLTRIFDHMIIKKHWRYKDHWLAYFMDVMSQIEPTREYLQFARKNVDGYLGFVKDRITTFPTLLELMMATRRVFQRYDVWSSDGPSFEIDQKEFDTALHRRAERLMDGVFWPEFAMYFAVPSSVSGAFFIRHHAFRVRIDDVEHYLSGLVMYRNYLEADSMRPAGREGATHD